MAKHKNKQSLGKTVFYIIAGLASLVLCITLLLQDTDVALFSPKGLIAGEQHSLIIFTVTILLSVAIPTILLLFFVAWKYRESNEKAKYDPNVRHGKFFIVT
ncbi:MAG: hypothetical protein WC733_09385, partial [Methylophilus sp.]